MYTTAAPPTERIKLDYKSNNERTNNTVYSFCINIEQKIGKKTFYKGRKKSYSLLSKFHVFNLKVLEVNLLL